MKEGESKRSKDSEKSSSKGDMLLIFDGCDQFVDKNRVSFDINISFLSQQYKNMSMILISEEKLQLETKVKLIEIVEFSEVESLIYMLTINQSHLAHIKNIIIQDDQLDQVKDDIITSKIIQLMKDSRGNV